MRTDNTYDSEMFAQLAESSYETLSQRCGGILEAHISVIDAYDEQIEKIEEKVERKILELPVAQRLLTILGVAPL